MPEFIPGQPPKYNTGEVAPPTQVPFVGVAAAQAVASATPKASSPPVSVEQAIALADQRHSIAHSISSQRVQDPDRIHEPSQVPPASLTG